MDDQVRRVVAPGQGHCRLRITNNTGAAVIEKYAEAGKKLETHVS